MDDTLVRQGNYIRHRRIALGLTSYDLADLVGVRQPTVFRWEKGDLEPRLKHKRAIAEALHDDVAIMFNLRSSDAGV